MIIQSGKKQNYKKLVHSMVDYQEREKMILVVV